MKRLLFGLSPLFLGAALAQGCGETTPNHENAGNDAGMSGLDAAVDSGSGSDATDSGHQVQSDSGTPSGDGDAHEGKDAGSDASVSVCSAEDSSGCLDQVAASAQSDFGFHWKDSWFIMGCPMKDADGHDCRSIAQCPNGDAADFEDRGAVANETFPLGGQLGTTYAVTFQFNGLAEGKYYEQGSYAQPDVDKATPNGPEPEVKEAEVNSGSFYIGGKAVATDYNVMRMRVLDSNHNEVARYYLNGFPQNSGAESHRTFLFSYQHTIQVPGQGFVEYRFQDANCKAVDNCGAGWVDDNGPCDQGRSIPNEPNVTLPAMYTDVASASQPHLVPLTSLNPVSGTSQPWHAQIGHVTITKVIPE